MSPSRSKFVPVLIAGLGLLLYVPNLGGPPLAVWDEAMYANAARNMATEGYWIVPHTYWTTAELSPFLFKPPLVMWLQGLSMSVFGITAFAARLPVALLTICLALVVFRIGRELFDWRAGLISAFVLLIYPPIYAFGHSGRSGALDVPLVLFGTLFVWWVYRGRETPRTLLPAGAAAAGAVLTKGVAAGVFLIVLAPYVAYHYRDYVRWEAVAGAVIGIVLIIPWPLYAYSRYGDDVIEGLILRQVRRGSGELTPTGDPLFGFMNYPYFRSLTQETYLLPLSIAFGVVIWSYYRTDRSIPRIELFLLWWVLAVPITFAVLGGDHGWYLLPMVPPLTILVGRAGAELVTLWNDTVDREFPQFRASDGRLVVIGVIVTVVLAIALPHVMTGFTAAGQESHEELGKAFEDTDTEAVIHVEEGELKPRHYAFAFYANRPLATFSRDRADRGDVRYAVVNSSTVSDIDQEHRVLHREGETVAVEFTGGTRSRRSIGPHRSARESAS